MTPQRHFALAKNVNRWNHTVAFSARTVTTEEQLQNRDRETPIGESSPENR